MGKKRKAPKNKGSKIITAVFYVFYFLLIFGFAVGMLAFHDYLETQLVAFEAATQHTVKSEEVFQELFADPDWGALYASSGLTDTRFEGQDAFVVYMEALVGEAELTYEEEPSDSDNHKYLLHANGQTLGYFTLANRAKANAVIPDWKLDEVQIFADRALSVTVMKQDSHTVYVNGQPLDDSYTVEILSTQAEKFLPEGTVGIRRHRQEVTGLLITPEITVLDAQGNVCPVHFDDETGIYSEEFPDHSNLALPEDLEKRIIAAGEAYCTYMTEQNNYLLYRYFASGTDTYRAISSAAPWRQDAVQTEITGRFLSEYCRYTENQFSVRVKMTMTMTFEDESTRSYPLDATFFFENRKDGWMVTAMTNEDFSEETSRVRLTFLYGDTILSTAFYDRDETDIHAPQISAPADQVFAGWGTDDGAVVFTCGENGKLNIPEDTVLEPMALYAVFENTTAESEENQ